MRVVEDHWKHGDWAAGTAVVGEESGDRRSLPSTSAMRLDVLQTAHRLFVGWAASPLMRCLRCTM